MHSFFLILSSSTFRLNYHNRYDILNVIEVIALSLNNRIREARKKKGISQEELGKLIGVAKTTVSGYENNHEPTAAKLGEIADVLNVDVNFLLQDEMNEIKKESPAPAKAEAGEDIAKSQLLKNYEALNKEGQTRLCDYSDDLVSSEKYTKNNQPEVCENA